jgi:SAM-dependent methyltransferase
MAMHPVLEPVAKYYAGKLREHGTTPRGVDWNSPESQERRFTELLRVCGDDRSGSFNDYGCGYGALAARLRRDGWTGAYTGYDVSPEMVGAAEAMHANLEGCRFTTDGSALAPASYTIASGIFNVRLETSLGDWEQYVRDTIARMAALSERGFAFNMLTAHSDPDRMRDDLYYADPAAWLTELLLQFPRRITLLHDYPLYEFTVMVKMGSDPI